jgi:hypothetical protein
VSGKLLWIHRKLAQKREMVRDVFPPEFVSGESIFYLGRSYRLRIVDKARAPLGSTVRGLSSGAVQRPKPRSISGDGSWTKARHGSARDRPTLNA